MGETSFSEKKLKKPSLRNNKIKKYHLIIKNTKCSFLGRNEVFESNRKLSVPAARTLEQIWTGLLLS